MINISGISKAKILASLYNNSIPLGLGILHYTPQDMTEDEAQKLLDETPNKYFDYVQGRVMKVDLSKDELDPWLYDRDNGQGAAEKIINILR